MMRSKNFQLVRSAARTTFALLLAASTVALAQTPSAVPSPDSNSGQQQTNTNGGWKRVGDHSEVNSPEANGNQAPSEDNTLSQAPDPNQAPNQGPYNQAQYPPATQGQAGPAQPAYGQQPQYGPQAPYAQQPQYGPPQQNTQQQNYPPPPPVPARLTMPAGTYVTVRVNQMLSSDKNQPGDAFTASLMQPVVVNGVVVAEPGQTLGGQVVTVQKHHYGTPARLGVQLTNMTLVDGQQLPIATQFISRRGGTTPGGAEAGTVAATTGVGAIIGAAAGWGTGAAIGAGAGAAAGLIGVLVTHNHASVIYPEQVLTFRIQAPVTISTENGSQAFRYVEPNEYDRPAYANRGGQGMYESAAPPAPVYDTYAYGYPYYGYPYYGYPYYWGPSFAFYGGGWWGGRSYPHGYWGGRGFYGGRGGYVGGRGYAGGGFARAGGGAHFSGGAVGHGGGGHR